MNISMAIGSAAEVLKNSGIPESRREAASLLLFVLQRTQAFLIAHPDYELNSNQKILFETAVRRREKREPFQYIVGSQEFFGLDFFVAPGVLIPRPETEILVEAAIGTLSKIVDPSFCEVGIGSGCISISILRNVMSAHAVAVDISPAAMSIAAKNALNHGVATRLQIFESNAFKGVTGRFDMIVSNPPYIPAGQIATLQAEVRQFEPHSALDGGPDGLMVIRTIVESAPKFLKPNGILLIEIGFGLSESVKDLFDRDIWRDVVFLDDLQGIPRIVSSEILSLPTRKKRN